MSSPEREYTAADELARHAEWLRRLARALADGEAEAEDVAQATWERVLNDRGSGGFGLRPLLARVARSLSRRRRRTDSRRREWERAAARRNVWPSAAEIAARVELTDRLALALGALDERRRTVVVMRYFDGSSSADIARQLGMPAATVRSHLKRGLDELRVHLGADRAGEGDPTRAVLILGVQGETPPAAIAGGFGLLTGTVMVAVAVTAAVLLGWSFWSVTTNVSPSLHPESAQGVSAPELTAAGDGAHGRGAPDTSGLDDLDLDPALARAVAEDETPRGGRGGWWLSGRILGLAPQDAEEAHLKVSASQGRTRFLTTEATSEGTLELEISSLFLEEQSGLTELWVEFDHPSYMPEAWRIPIGRAERQAGEFQGVATVVSFEGQVKRVPTYVTGRVGVPPGYDPALVSAALIALDDEGEPLEHAVAVEDCDAEGEFRLRTDRNGPHLVVALHRRMRSEALRPEHAWVEVEGAKVELPDPLVMDPGATIEGRVVLLPGSLAATPQVLVESHVQDAPVVRAGRDLRWIEGRFEYWYSNPVTTDADGRFRFEGLRPGNHSLRVTGLQPGGERVLKLRNDAAETWMERMVTAPAVLTLDPNVRLQGFVVEGSDGPLDGAQLTLETGRHVGRKARRATTDAEGRFVLLVDPHEEAKLTLGAVGHLARVIDPAVMVGPWHRVRLDPAPALAGAIVVVELRGDEGRSVEELEALFVPLEGEARRPFGETRRRITDTLEFSAVPAGRYRLTLQADSPDGPLGAFLIPWVEEVDLQAGERRAVVIEAQFGGLLLISGPLGGSYDMQLHDAQGEPVSITIRMQGQGYADGPYIEVTGRGVLVPGFDHLTCPLIPGDYFLEVQQLAIAGQARRHNLTIRLGEVTRINPFQ